MLLVTKRDRWYRNKLRAIFRGVRACPRHNWATVVAKLNEGGGSWRTERLVRAMKLLVAEHLAEPALLGRAPRKSANRRARDAAAAMRRASPTITLQEIGRQLQAMAIPSARGHLSWSRDHVFKWRRR